MCYDYSNINQKQLKDLNIGRNILQSTTSPTEPGLLKVSCIAIIVLPLNPR